LALNATIEAARAGDAGKGFAVVANEVKSLANATARATTDISNRIGVIQSETQSAADAIGAIVRVIDSMNEIATTVAAAVEEQDAATREIAQNVSHAAASTSEVAVNVTTLLDITGQTRDSTKVLVVSAHVMARLAMEVDHNVKTFSGRIREEDPAAAEVGHASFAVA
jgi:methyl-accepting chemotaxis protein